MTSQDKINYLKQYKRLDARITRKIEECERWRAVAEKVTPSYSSQPKCSGGDGRIITAVEHITEIEQELNADIDTLVDIKRNTQQAIDKIDNPIYRELLERRYLDGCTFERVSVDMNYDYRWVLRLHGKAINSLTIKSHI